LLASLSPDLANNGSLIKEIIEARTREPFQNITDVTNLTGAGTNSQDWTRLLTTTSGYFTITGVGTYAGTRRFVYATFRSNPSGTAILVAWNED
jgi:type II secretory pathway component PulK